MSVSVPLRIQLSSARKGLVTASLCLTLFLQLPTLGVCQACPDTCHCHTGRIQCRNQGLQAIPSLPKDVWYLLVTGNNIVNLTNESFPNVLGQLMELHLNMNGIQLVGPHVFANLPNLKILDLSYNNIQIFSPEAFLPAKMSSNMNRRVNNSSQVGGTLDSARSGAVQLSVLDLSNNNLVFLPEKLLSTQGNLSLVNLRNNSIVSINNGTFRNPKLQKLDLRDNILKVLDDGTVTDFSRCPDLRLLLVGNLWRCDCSMEYFVSWLKESDQVLDKQNLSCVSPENLERVGLLQLNSTDLQCSFSDNIESMLQTSYFFLGLVLALIGLMFLLVLYLNRKGIKRWLFNIRDACRDHMEGYQYRYEVSSDSRVTNLCLNSDA